MLVNSFINNQVITIGKQDLDEYPQTVSKFWLKIDDMKSLYINNPHFVKNIDYLRDNLKISAWKRSRGDGNCYFRAVITSYLEKITKPYSPLSHLTAFQSILKALSLEDTINEYHVSHSRVSLFISTLVSKKSANEHFEVFKLALSELQNPEFDLDLIRVSRLVAYTELLRSQDDPDYSVFFIDGIDSIVYDILEMNREGGDFTLVFLPKGLNAQVIQYMFLDTENRSVQYFPEKSKGELVSISLVRRSCHYDILCEKQEIELDQCDIDKGLYYFSYDFEFYQRVLKAVERKKVKFEENS